MTVLTTVMKLDVVRIRAIYMKVNVMVWVDIFMALVTYSPHFCIIENYVVILSIHTLFDQNQNESSKYTLYNDELII